MGLYYSPQQHIRPVYGRLPAQMQPSSPAMYPGYYGLVLFDASLYLCHKHLSLIIRATSLECDLHDSYNKLI